ncbi:MAG TPA: TonB-dependent receptor [Lysobacter sp.]
MATRNNPQLRRNALTLALITTLFTAVPAHAQEAAAAEASKEPEAKAKTLDGVTVTGSRIKRAEIEGPAPVTVITSKDMEAAGFVTVYDAMSTITQASGEPRGSFAPLGDSIDLRGMGTGRTLLLINGRRAADYPWSDGTAGNFASFGNIPSAAVARIEVLSTGASAIYGSDAIGGVVNVVLKKDFEGHNIKVRGGTSTEGGRDSYNVQYVGGTGGDRWNLLWALQAQGRDRLDPSERDFMDSFRDNPGGIDPRLGYQPPLTLRLSNGAAPNQNFNLPMPEGTCEAFGYESFEQKVLSADGTVTNRGLACGDSIPRDTAAGTAIGSGRDNQGVYTYGTFDINDDLQAWTSVMASHSKAIGGGSMHSISGPQEDLRPTTTNWWDAGFNRKLSGSRRLHPNELNGKNWQYFEEKSYDFAVGLRGKFGDRFDWDATVGHAWYGSKMNRTIMDRSKMTEFFFGPRLDATAPGCEGAGTTPCYQLNTERWFRPMTYEEYQSISEEVVYDQESSVSQANFVVTGDLFDLPAGPVGFAGVLEAGEQWYDSNPPFGLRPDVGTLCCISATGGEGKRNRYAAGVEFAIPVTDTLRATLAGRFDKYDDITQVDDAKTWGLGLEWRPFSNLLLRGNYSTGFKAPDMHFVYSEGTGGTSNLTDVRRCLEDGGTANTASCPNATYQYPVETSTPGDPTLREETAKSWGVGMVWDVIDRLSVSVDYWSIEMTGEIRTVGVNNVVTNEAGCVTGMEPDRSPFPYAIDSEFCRTTLAHIRRAPPGPGQTVGDLIFVQGGYINQAMVNREGLDATLRYGWDTSFGTFNGSMGYSAMLKAERQIFADEAPLNIRDDFNSWQYRSRVRGSLGWNYGDWNANLFFTRVGSLPQFQRDIDPATGQRTIESRTSPFITWNASVGKKINDKLRLTFFVNNLFNNFHVKDETHTSFEFFKRHYSPVGREVALQAEYQF